MRRREPHTAGGAWVAVGSSTDPRERARTLARARESMLAGGAASPAVVRDVIAASWRRCRRAGVDAERGVAADAGGDDAAARWDTHPLAQAGPTIRELLGVMSGAADEVVVFADADGTLLRSEGDERTLARARETRLRPGTVWTETSAGTNAIGTALATGHPVQVFSAEHYAKPVHPWICSAAPVRDPESGASLGVLNLSAPYATANPHSLAVVTAGARVMEQEIRRTIDADAARLVERFGGRIGRGPGHPQALATASGRVLVAHIAELTGRRLALPSAEGLVALPVGGTAIAEPLPGDRGFLLWPAARDQPYRAPGSAIRMDALGRDRALVRIGDATHLLTPRHSELLALLALRPSGWRAEELASELFRDLGKPVSVRAELARLRRVLGDVIDAQPYRLRAPICADFMELESELSAGRATEGLDRFAGELLPSSTVPSIAETRFRLTTSLRESVMAAADPELLRRWLQLPVGDDDAQACRALMALCPPADFRHTLAAGRLRRLSGARQ
ncbi:MAG TPA: GAF domain-containing protein [Conexibacter sp.]|nr:GAF domain-containing protein [Conexibacter sp.]